MFNFFRRHLQASHFSHIHILVMYLQLSYLLFRLHMEIRSRYLCVKITSGLLILYNKPYQTNYTENEMDGQVYQQPSEENNLLSPHHREEATDPNEQVL